MNNLIRPSQTFVNNGATLPAQGSTIASITSGVLGVFGSSTNSMTEVSAAPTITTEPALTLFSGYSDGTIKKGMTIKGSAITKYNGERYSPDTRDAWSIGYNRYTAAGSLQVVNNAVYTYIVAIKYDKSLYSERPLDFRISFTSDSGATQQTICAQIYALLTANKQGVNKDVKAIIVSNGPSTPVTFVYNGITYTVYGDATNATASLYGIEFTGADIPQFQNTQYMVRRPYFAVFVDTTTAFGNSTSVGQINAMTTGNGIYDAVYNQENFDYGYEGVLNRTQWPIPTLAYNASTTFYSSAALVPTVTVVATSDIATFSASVSGLLPVGARIVIGTSNEVAEIKYFISTTVAVLVSPIVTSESTVTVKMNFQYSVIDIEFRDTIVSSIGGVDLATKTIKIAFPAIDAGGAYNSISAVGTSLKALFDAYCASAPGSFAPISI